MKKILIFLSMLLSGITGIAQHVISTPTPQGYWNLNGNTTGASNWLGSSNSQPLIFKTNNTERFRIGSAGTFSFNTYSVNFGTGGTVLYTTGASSLYVPYTGATGSVNLGANSFSVGGTSTLTGAVQTSSINNNGGNLNLGAYGGYQGIFSGGQITFNPASGSTTGSLVPFAINTPSQFSLTASTNIPAFKVTGATRGFMSGAKALQYETYLTAPTYSATAATTITTASGLHVEKPIAGSNVTITNNYGISTDGNLLLGSAGLTGGNTGTVAVLSDAVFPLTFNGNVVTVNDAGEYYWGNNPYLFSGAVSNGTVTIPYNATLVRWDFSYVNGGTLATSESATLSIKGTTNYTCNTAITFTATNGQYSGTSLSQNFSAGDRINTSLLMPTFATNPSYLYVGITLWFVRRQ